MNTQIKHEKRRKECGKAAKKIVGRETHLTDLWLHRDRYVIKSSTIQPCLGAFRSRADIMESSYQDGLSQVQEKWRFATEVRKGAAALSMQDEQKV